MFRLKVALARLVRAVSRRAGRSGGTTAPGRLLLALDDTALERLGRRLDEGSVLVSGTNGKTTSASMISNVMKHAGRPLVHNRAGSNMTWGVATALLDAGDRPRELGLFEVDEAWLARVAHALEPHTILLSNLFRDQLDRYGELETIADRWAAVVAGFPGTALVLLSLIHI